MSSNNQVNTEKAYQAALLSDAAYINLIEGEDFDETTGKIKWKRPNTAKKFIEGREFTKEQLEHFSERYTIKHIQLNTDTGFAGTVFIDTKNNNQPIVAMRGTEDFGDQIVKDILKQDITLAVGLSTTFGMGQQTGEIVSFLKKAGLLDANNLSKQEFNKKVNFVGHSLGGHLALIASYFFPELQNEIYTYNGAGIARTLDLASVKTIEFFRQLRNLPILNDKKIVTIQHDHLKLDLKST